MSVSLSEPYLKAWIGLIAALLPPAGIGLIIIVSFTYALVSTGFSTRGLGGVTQIPLSIAFLLLHLVACVPLSILAIAFRRRFLRRPMQIQRFCVLIAWIAVLASITCFFSQALR